jgi:hypothetical protein
MDADAADAREQQGIAQKGLGNRVITNKPIKEEKLEPAKTPVSTATRVLNDMSDPLYYQPDEFPTQEVRVDRAPRFSSVNRSTVLDILSANRDGLEKQGIIKMPMGMMRKADPTLDIDGLQNRILDKLNLRPPEGSVQDIQYGLGAQQLGKVEDADDQDINVDRDTPTSADVGVQLTDGKAPLDPNSFTQKHLKKVEATDYDTLFANAEKTSKQFKDVKITDMSIGDLIEFTKPSGAYGKWVKPRLPESTEAYQKGLTSTPLGKYQIVGTTLKRLVKGYGWDLEKKFTKEVQDRMFLQLAYEALDNKETMDEKVKSMRSVWEGLREGKGSTKEDVVKIIKEIERGRLFKSPRPRQKPRGVMERPPL